MTRNTNEPTELDRTDDESATDASVADPETEPGLTFSDTVVVGTSPEDLWAFVSDAENLAACIPGAESVARRSEREYTFEITRGISHVTVTLTGEFELVEMDEPDWIVAEGSAFDSTTGSDFDVIAAMEMVEVDDGTALSYSAELYYTGGVARLGARLLRSVIQSDVEAYFENVRTAVEK